MMSETKVVYLMRHAQSMENQHVDSLFACCSCRCSCCGGGAGRRGGGGNARKSGSGRGSGGGDGSESERRLLGDERSSSRARVVIVDSDDEEEEDDDEVDDDFFDESVDSCADLLCSPFRLLRVGRDAALSTSGHEKAAQVGALAADDDFFRTAGIELCVHSPLQRAVRTLEHVLYPTYIREVRRGTAGSPMRSASSSMKTYGVDEDDEDVYNSGDDNDSSVSGSSDNDSESSRSGSDNDGNKYGNEIDGAFVGGLRAPLRQKSMRRRQRRAGRRETGSSIVETAADMDDIRKLVPFPIVCCESLAEETPGEFLVARWRFRRRIKFFETWLATRNENTVFITGHSAFFKHMLGQRKKFNNCDVFRVDFTVFHGGDAPQTTWSQPRLVYRVCRKKSDATADPFAHARESGS